MATFLGKYAFGSTEENRAQQFLAAFRLRSDWLPGMHAGAANDPAAVCILSDTGNGTSIRLQSQGRWLYLTVGNLGWITFTAVPGEAGMFQMSGAAAQQSWTVTVQASPVKVGYALDPPPLLTVNDNPYRTFASTQITPPLSAILASRNGAGMDLSEVDLGGQDLSGIDFTGANFAGADLTGTRFAGCMLKGARFDGAVLANAMFDGATLDGATFREPSTDVSQVAWGKLKSAAGIDFSRCHAGGTRLGGNVIDFSGANLSGANFSGADLSYLNLSGCTAVQAILADGCNCSHANFDDGNMRGVVAPRGIFTNASMQRVSGGGAVFIAADLGGADLTEAQFGANLFLFSIPEALAADFDAEAYAGAAIIAAFGAHGTTLSAAAITVLAPGASWRVTDPNAGSFSVINHSGLIALDVFRIGGAMPAAFTFAKMQNTVATSAGFASADFTGAQWTGDRARGDHADLESAALVDALLFATDFTQATISGTSFAGSVLIGAKLNGCTIGPGGDGRSTSFAGAQLQGTQFVGANLDNVLLAAAAVSLVEGVPLFVMPSSYQADLNSAGLAALAQYFAQRGMPLAANAAIASATAWRIDNSSDSQPHAVAAFLVHGADLGVFDAGTAAFLFRLSANLRPALAAPAPPPQLIAAFAANGYDLAATASIAAADYWQITNPATLPSPAAYQFIRIYARPDGLHVYGAVTLALPAWPHLGPIAFGPTLAIQPALNAASLCPNGYPRAMFEAGVFTWEEMMTNGG